MAASVTVVLANKVVHILHGHYRWGTRRAACKHEYCTICQRERMVEGYRSFRVIHLFFVPVIPLGNFTDWRCSTCGKDPYSKRPMPPWISVPGFVLGACAFVGVAIAPWEDDDFQSRIIMLCIFGALAAFSGYSLFGKRRREYLALRRAVQPLPKDVCPLCGQPTLQRSKIRCELCRVELR